jgi:hypothetical protein
MATIGPAATMVVLAGVRSLSAMLELRVVWASVPLVLTAAALAARIVLTKCGLLRSNSPRRAKPALAVAATAIAPFAIALIFGLSSTITLGGIDGPRHGYFVAEMTQSNRTDAQHVLTHDPQQPGAAGAYYPLSVHVAAATIHELTGTSIANVFQALGILITGVMAPAGMYFSAAKLSGSATAGAVASLVGSFGFGWALLGWSYGWMPYTMSLTMVPAVLALSTAMTSPRERVAATIACGGILAIHPAGFITLTAAVAGGAAVRLVLERKLLKQGTATSRWTALSPLAAGFVLVAPEGVDFVRGSMERTKDGGTFGQDSSVIDMVNWSAGGLLPQPFGFALVLAGLVGLWQTARRGRPQLLVIWSVLSLGTIAVVSLPPQLGRLVTVPWNGDVFRMVVTQYGFIAIGAGTMAPRLIHAARHRLSTRPSLVLAAIGLSCLAPWQHVAAEHVDLTSAGTHNRQQAWQWLSDTAPGAAVITGSSSDGGLWLETLDSAHPIVGWPPEFTTDPVGWLDRLDLLRSAIGLSTRCDRAPSCLPAETFLRHAAEHCATYVIASNVSFARGTAVTIEAARSRPYLHWLATFGDVEVFGVSNDECVVPRR